jgi:hypothetical protein
MKRTPVAHAAVSPDIAPAEAGARAARGRKAGRRVAGPYLRIEPTTLEHGVAPEVEFMEAMRQYKEQSGRLFPTWSEVLEVFQGLGYQKVARPDSTPETASPIAVDLRKASPRRRASTIG